MRKYLGIGVIVGAAAITLGACGSDSTDRGGTSTDGGGATDGGGGTGGSTNTCGAYCQKANAAGCAPANCASTCAGKSTCVPSWNALVACAAETGSVVCNAGTAEITGCDAELQEHTNCTTPADGGGAGGGTGGRPIVLPAGCATADLVVECNPLTNEPCDRSGEGCDFWTVDGAPGFYCLGGSTRAPGAPCDNSNGPWCQGMYHCAPDPNAGSGGSAGGGGSAGAAGSGAAGAAGSAGASTVVDASVPDDGPTSSADAADADAADASGASCAGHCGSQEPVPGSDPPCYCDNACEGQGDCCFDKRQECPIVPNPGICQKMCCGAGDCASGEVCNPFDASLGTAGICQPQ
jgi:hypothetical protein